MTTGEQPPQDDNPTTPSESPPPAEASSDQQLEVDNITGFSGGFPPIPELGTVDDNQLWGADFGVLE